MPYINKINVGGVLYDVQDLEASTAVPQIKQMISNVESSPATAAHAAGSYLIYNNTLYRASADIAVGDALTVGTNIAAVSGGLAGDVADLKSAIGPIIINVPASVNLFDKNLATDGYLIVKNTGEPSALAGWAVSDFIPVTAGETYTRSNISGLGYCGFYDSSKTHIASSDTNLKTFTAPSGASYFRYTLDDTKLSQAMLVKGDTLPSQYVPYSPAYETVKITDFENTFSDEAKEDIKDYVLSDVSDLQDAIFGNNPVNAWKGKKVLCIGDSLTRFGTWFEQLGTMLGMTVERLAQGGQSIEGLFGPNAQLVNKAGTTVGVLTCEHVCDKDLIIVFAGTNNRTTSAGQNTYTIGQVGDVWSGGSKTVAGCIQFAINKLYTLLEGDSTYDANLSARVVFVTPYYVGKDENYQYTGIEDYNGNGVSLEAVAQMMEDVCGHNGIPVYSSFKNTNINPNTWSIWCANTIPSGGTVPDQIHLNSAGYAHLGKCITKWVQTI